MLCYEIRECVTTILAIPGNIYRSNDSKQ